MNETPMTSTLHPPETAPSFDAMLAELRGLLASDKPGVWEARTFADGNDMACVVRDGEVLFEVDDDFDSFDAELVLAAKLRNTAPAIFFELDRLAKIAAAMPELLAALKLAQARYQTMWGNVYSGGVGRERTVIDAAIAKVEG